MKDDKSSFLKSSIILPAGLIVTTPPKKIEIIDNQHVASIIFSLTPNTFGEVLYYLDKSVDDEEKRYLLRFFPERFLKGDHV